MRFALVNGERREPQPGLSGECSSCAHPMVARCGPIRIRHWAHRGERSCDPWWENETEWHRNWKDQFPVDWQEIDHLSSSGEKHRADVKTDQGLVIEFQYSFLNSEERRARNDFYAKLVWVVNGSVRKRDKSQFFNAFKKGIPLEAYPQVRTVPSDGCVLLREWANDRAPVFFDFGEESRLWLLVPKSSIVGWEHVFEFPCTKFVEIYRNGGTQADEFQKLLETINPPDLQRRLPILGPPRRGFRL